LSRLERNVNIAAVVVPFAALLAGAVLAWQHLLGARDVAIFALMYLLTRSA
jgi:hypothetical protein